MSATFDVPLPERLESVADVDGAAVVNSLGVRFVRAGHLVDAYPAGAFDREMVPFGAPFPAEVARITDAVLAADPRCRRVVLAVPERDLSRIAWAEAAGYRYVVDVETREGAYSLLVTEPEWVLAQPHVLEDIPLKE